MPMIYLTKRMRKKTTLMLDNAIGCGGVNRLAAITLASTSIR